MKQPRKTAWRRMRRGLTLIEAIAAMTILSFGIVAVLGAISSCLRSAGAAASYSRGALLAQQVAAELARAETLEPGELSGTFDDVDEGYRWTAVVDEANEEGLYPVSIVVSWQTGTRNFFLNTVLRPHALPGPPTPQQEEGEGGNQQGGPQTDNQAGEINIEQPEEQPGRSPAETRNTR